MFSKSYKQLSVYDLLYIYNKYINISVININTLKLVFTIMYVMQVFLKVTHISSYSLTSWYWSVGAGQRPAAAVQILGCGTGGCCVGAASASWLTDCSTPAQTSAPTWGHDAIHIQFKDETQTTELSSSSQLMESRYWLIFKRKTHFSISIQK